MSERFDPLPNVEAAIGTALNEAGFRAYSSIPGEPTYPLLVSNRLGGVAAEVHSLDAPRIQVEAWGDRTTSKSEVWRLARDAYGALLELAEAMIELADERVFVTEVRPEIAPQWLPDPRTARPRYIFSVRVYARRLLAPS